MDSVSIQVRPNMSIGTLSQLWRPGIMIFLPEASVFSALSALPTLGYVRVAFDFQVFLPSTSFADAQARTSAQIGTLQGLQAQGATIVITTGLMPQWLSSQPTLGNLTPGGVAQWACYRPAVDANWDALITQTVGQLSAAGIHPYYDFWNEPGSNFWLDTLSELWRLAARTFGVIRAADPLAKAGGCSFANPAEGPPHFGLIVPFMNYLAANGRPKMDFLSVHLFASLPTDQILDLGAISATLSANGYDGNLPILMPEYNAFSGRNTIQNSAFILSALASFESVNIQGAMFAVLQDFNNNESNGQGLFTRSPTAEKPSWSVMKSLAALPSDRIEAQVYANDAGTLGVGSLATRDQKGTQILVWRYDSSSSAPIAAEIFSLGQHRLILQPFDVAQIHEGGAKHREVRGWVN
jgi:hypothetical protein